MSGLRFKFFAEHTHLDLERTVNQFLSRSDIEYIDHDFIADGLEKPYNMSLVFRERKNKSLAKRQYWRDRVFGR